MNWTAFGLALAYMAAGALMMLVIYGWIRVGDAIEQKWGGKWALAYGLSTMVLIPPTVVGLLA